MDLPNEDTLKIIEERKDYLVKKSEKTPVKNGYELREIKALEKIINLINVFQNNIPSELKKEFAEKVFVEKANEEELDDKNYEVLHLYEQELAKNSILDIKFIEMKNNSKKYIILALKVYKEKSLKWVYQGKIRLTPIILEQILNKSNEIMKLQG
ncbi:MAG: hypothetical protein LBQ82_07235 [Treponema sp.]|jgi:hypothetical protein|nr:hypothetical protein [Treponema sp.]